MNDPITLLFTLLRGEVAGDAAALQSIGGQFEEDAAEKLYELAKQNQLEGLLAEILIKHRLLPQDSSVLAKFKKSLHQVVFRQSVLEQEQEQVCRLLEQAQIPFLPLKGAVVRKYYPQAHMRSSNDVDILVHPEQVEQAVALLCDQLGYLRQDSLSDHDCHLFSPSGAAIELHYKLIESTRLPSAAKILETVWEESAPTEGSDFHMEMSGEMFLFYHLAHMAKHILAGGCGIRPFIDLWLIRRYLSIDADRLQTMLEQAQLEQFYDNCLRLTQVWFAEAAHTATSQALAQFILAGGAHGNLSTIQAIRAAKGESKTKAWLELLILPRRNLELLYPQLKAHPHRMAYYQVKRWFKVLHKDKRDTALKIASSRAVITKTETDEVGSLLDGLGL